MMADVAEQTTDIETTEAFDVEDFDSGEVDATGDDLADEVSDEAAEFASDDEDEEVEQEASGDDEDEEQEEQESEKKKSAPRYEKRVRQLLQQRKEAQEEVAAHTERNNQLLQYIQKQEARQEELTRQMQELREGNIGYQKELELQRLHREQQEEADLDPAERITRQAVRKANEIAKAERDREIASLREEFEADQQSRREEAERVAKEGRIAGYRQQNDMACAELLQDLPAETARSLFEPLTTHALNFSASHSYQDLRDGAKAFDRFATKYVMAKMKLAGKKVSETRGKGKKVPAANPTSRRAVKGSPVPKMKPGDVDHLDAIRRQRGE
jgi:hypothetical protein